MTLALIILACALTVFAFVLFASFMIAPERTRIAVGLMLSAFRHAEKIRRDEPESAGPRPSLSMTISKPIIPPARRKEDQQ